MINIYFEAFEKLKYGQFKSSRFNDVIIMFNNNDDITNLTS